MRSAKPKLEIITSLDDLRERVLTMLSKQVAVNILEERLSKSLPTNLAAQERHVSGFLNHLVDLVPGGDVYLFGGLLRDVAFLGGQEFRSDIDLVVEGEWTRVAQYVESLGAARNRFGGYRLRMGGWPIDIWSAKRTWAISKGYINFSGIDSLLDTTILNWDAILMSWKTHRIICHDDYLQGLRERKLDIVLEKNPHPLGMAVRIFRQQSLKGATRVSIKAAKYAIKITRRYSYQQLAEAELRSYGDQFIGRAVYEYFSKMNYCDAKERVVSLPSCDELDVGENVEIDAKGKYLAIPAIH